jgi:hypothetical protein
MAELGLKPISRYTCSDGHFKGLLGGDNECGKNKNNTHLSLYHFFFKSIRINDTLLIG